MVGLGLLFLSSLTVVLGTALAAQPNVPPIANADFLATPFNTPVTVSVTANNIDADGNLDASSVDLDPLTGGQQTTFTVPGQGVFTADGSGNVTFTPASGFVGTVVLSYTVSDDLGATSSPTDFTVQVLGPSAIPTLSPGMLLLSLLLLGGAGVLTLGSRG